MGRAARMALCVSYLMKESNASVQSCSAAWPMAREVAAIVADFCELYDYEFEGGIVPLGYAVSNPPPVVYGDGLASTTRGPTMRLEQTVMTGENSTLHWWSRLPITMLCESTWTGRLDSSMGGNFGFHTIVPFDEAHAIAYRMSTLAPGVVYVDGKRYQSIPTETHTYRVMDEVFMKTSSIITWSIAQLPSSSQFSISLTVTQRTTQWTFTQLVPYSYAARLRPFIVLYDHSLLSLSHG